MTKDFESLANNFAEASKRYQGEDQALIRLRAAVKTAEGDLFNAQKEKDEAATALLRFCAEQSLVL